MCDASVILRLTLTDPVSGVTYSLQNKDNHPVAPQTAGDGPLSFDVPLRLSEDGRWLGPFVRREGPERRFVYIAIGTSAGDHSSEWTRRAKIDIHDMPDTLKIAARSGGVPEARLPGRGKDGSPACASVRVREWRLAEGSENG